MKCLARSSGIEPTYEEMFAKCHLKKDKSWVDTRYEKAFVCDVTSYSFSLIEPTFHVDQPYRRWIEWG